jgi:MinD superfamily P-loop ATPase
MVAVNLALALHRSGRPVRFLDVDVEEPNAALFMAPGFSRRQEFFTPVPRIDEELCNYCGKCAEFCAYGALAVTKNGVLVFDELCHSCGGCRMVCPNGAISDRGYRLGTIDVGETENGIEFVQGTLDIGEPKASPLIEAVKEHIDQRKVNILDCGPGTGCAVMTSVRGADCCLLVTEPTPFGLHDLEMAAAMVNEMGVRAYVIINKDSAEDSELRAFCSRCGLRVIGSIPFSPDIASLTSRGHNLVDRNDYWLAEFMNIYERLLSFSMQEV